MARKPKRGKGKTTGKRRRETQRDRDAVERYVTDEILLAMGKANVDPAFAYAFKKTGLMPPLKGTEKNWPKENLKEWREAVREYREMEDKRKLGDAPDPKQWQSEIPALVLSGFNKEDFARVKALIKAIEPVERAGPMTLRARWEFAAAVLASALSSAYSAGVGTNSPEDAPKAVQELFDATISIVVKRAMEIYSQG